MGDSFSSFYICGSYWKMCEEIRTEVHKLQSADQIQLHLTSGLGETEYFSIFKGYKNRRICHANHMYPTMPKIFSPWSFTMFLDSGSGFSQLSLSYRNFIIIFKGLQKEVFMTKFTGDFGLEF